MSDYIKELRKQVGHHKLIVPGVRAVIMDDKRQILLQMRSDFRKWSLPAGSIELDECAFEALKREVEEETGLDVLEATPMGVYSDPKYSLRYPNGDEVQIFTLAFVIRRYRGSLKIDNDETLGLRWFAIEDIFRMPEDLLMPIARETIEDYESWKAHEKFIVK